MNIFILSQDPQEAARLQCDRHVVKMVVETAQILSTAHRILDGKETTIVGPKRKKKHWELIDAFREKLFYRATHRNHPCCVWARESLGNYIWLYEHFIALCDEYTYRYGKIHRCDSLFRGVLDEAPSRIPDVGLTEFATATNTVVSIEDIVQRYRAFYITKKTKFKMTWKKRQVPDWFQ